jgi:hypothetical protein
LILIALIIFIAQNAGAVQVSFVSLHGRFSLAVALLAAVAAGCLLTLVLGTVRILQLHRRHRDDLAAAVVSHTPDTLSGAPQPQHPVRDGADTARTGWPNHRRRHADVAQIGATVRALTRQSVGTSARGWLRRAYGMGMRMLVAAVRLPRPPAVISTQVLLAAAYRSAGHGRHSATR